MERSISHWAHYGKKNKKTKAHSVWSRHLAAANWISNDIVVHSVKADKKPLLDVNPFGIKVAPNLQGTFEAFDSFDAFIPLLR